MQLAHVDKKFHQGVPIIMPSISMVAVKWCNGTLIILIHFLSGKVKSEALVLIFSLNQILSSGLRSGDFVLYYFLDIFVLTKNI